MYMHVLFIVQIRFMFFFSEHLNETVQDGYVFVWFL